jgi:GMP synthase-like glutamine amidotransferase
MHVHFFQHVSFEDLGSIEPWLKTTGCQITCTRFYENPALPEIDDPDMLIVMGGPMSVNDEKELPWLKSEKHFIRNFIDRQKPVLGICLGAQLIASAMGAQVYPNPEKEIGWHAIQRTPSMDSSFFTFPSTLNVFHWHGDTFELPSGAMRLARSEACDNQAFQLNDSVLGLQFHLETTAQSLKQLISQCRNQIVPAKYIQTENEMLSVTHRTYEQINDVMKGVLEFLWPQTTRKNN